MIDLVPLVNKTVPHKFRGAELKLDLSHALFSSYDVDAGTRLLLKAVGRDEVLLKARRVLDAGSGVGVIGLSIAAALPDCQVEARDRDLLACAFTERNRLRNKVGNLKVAPGLLSVATPGLSHAAGAEDGPWDYILTNIPAKAGGPVLEAFFKTSREVLLPGGRIGVVIVKPLVEQAKAWLATYGWELLVDERGANHHALVAALKPETADPAVANAQGRVSMAASATADLASEEAARTPPSLDFSGLDLGLYVRRRGRFKLADASYEASAIWGLPDFDTVGYGAEAAASLAARVLAGSLVRDVLVVNPGIGHLPLWIARKVAPERLTAASRDVLSLAATGANLASQPKPRPEYRAIDALRLDELPSFTFDLVAWNPDIVPEYDWIGPLWAEATRVLKRGGTLLVQCPPTELQRLEKRRVPGFQKAGEKRRKTFDAAAFTKL